MMSAFREAEGERLERGRSPETAMCDHTNKEANVKIRQKVVESEESKCAMSR